MQHTKIKVNDASVNWPVINIGQFLSLIGFDHWFEGQILKHLIFFPQFIESKQQIPTIFSS